MKITKIASECPIAKGFVNLSDEYRERLRVKINTV